MKSFINFYIDKMSHIGNSRIQNNLQFLTPLQIRIIGMSCDLVGDPKNPIFFTLSRSSSALLVFICVFKDM